MTIQKNMLVVDRFLHEVSRKPHTQEEWKAIQGYWPHGVVTRKSNGKTIMLSDAKLKNFHWYK